MYRKLFFLVIMIALTTSTLAQNLTKEEKAIEESIVQATRAWCERDYDGWQKLLIHDEHKYLISVGPNGFVEQVGWEEVSNGTKESFKNDPGKKPLVTFTDFYFRIVGDMAFVRCMQGNALTSRVMVKEDGVWKELYFATISANQFKTVDINNKMEKYAGEWKIDASTINVDPPWPFKITGGRISISCDKAKITSNAFYYCENPGGDWTYKEKTMYAFDTNRETIGVFRSGYGGSWSNVFSGKAELDENSLNTNFFRLGDTDQINHSEKWTWKGGNVIHQEITYFNKNGEKSRVFSCDWQRK